MLILYSPLYGNAVILRTKGGELDGADEFDCDVLTIC